MLLIDVLMCVTLHNIPWWTLHLIPGESSPDRPCVSVPGVPDVNLCLSLCQVFPMSILACLGSDADSIRDTYLSRLQASTEVGRAVPVSR